MTYDNTKPASGFAIVSRIARERRLPEERQLARCVSKTCDRSNVTTSTCYTATIAQLSRNQRVFIVNTEGYHRHIITSENASFWGIYKIN